MYHPLAIFIGLRYTRAKRRNHFISFISLTSMLGIALGITALITVLSVMNGFQQELRQRILSVTAHASVLGWGAPLTGWQGLQEALAQRPGVAASAPFIRAEAMLSAGGQVSGAALQGILPQEEAGVSGVADAMVQGQWNDLQPAAYGIVLGRALASALGVIVGEPVTVITPQASVTAIGVTPRLRRFVVVGIFEAGMYEYDRGLAYIHLRDAATLFRLGEDVTGLRLKLDDPFQAPRLSASLEGELPPGNYYLRDWTQEHANFFRAVQIEKTAMFVILTLIVAVAAFNIVSTLVMVVTDKRADIAILRTLGTAPGGIMAIFVVQGITIGVVGTLLGVVGGVALALNIDVVVPFIERLAGFKFLDPSVYLISDLPTQVQGSDVVEIAAVSLGLAVLATLYPAWRAARTQPAAALRYE